MSGSSKKTNPQKIKAAPWVKVFAWLLSVGLSVGTLVTVTFAISIDNSVDNIDDSVEDNRTKIDQTVENIDKLETHIGDQVDHIGDQIMEVVTIHNESASNQVEPIAIEGWLVLQTGGEFYQVVLDESPVSPITTTTTEAPSTPTDATEPEALPRPRMRDYRNELDPDGCHGVPGSDQWCFYGGGAASYVAWRVNSINFDGASTFDNMYRLDERPDGPTVWGHPRDWAGAARALGIEVDDTPTRGSIAQWDGDGDGEYGFVAYVEDVAREGDEDSAVTIVLSYMNYDGDAIPTDPTSWSLRDARTCRPDACGTRGWPDNLIHISDLR